MDVSDVEKFDHELGEYSIYTAIGRQKP
jgi:hypothetical protein